MLILAYIFFWQLRRTTKSREQLVESGQLWIMFVFINVSL